MKGGELRVPRDGRKGKNYNIAATGNPDDDDDGVCGAASMALSSSSSAAAAMFLNTHTQRATHHSHPNWFYKEVVT